MAELNKVIMIGNLTKDPEKVQYSGNTTIVNFRLAVNRTYKNGQGQKQNDVTFVDVKAFGKIADTLLKYATKGRQILVEGRLSMDEWIDKTTGGKRSKLYISAVNFQFLGQKDQGNGNHTTISANNNDEDVSLDDVVIGDIESMEFQEKK